MKKLVFAVLAVGLFGAGCEPIDPEGGGGGVEDVIFRNGYVFVRNDQIFMANAATPGAEEVPASALTSTGENHSPALSSDGRTVVFVSGSGAESELKLVNTVVDAQVRTLYSPSGNQRNLRFPVFSPDGLQIAFAYEDTTGGASFSAIGIVSSDGSGFRRLAGSATASYTSPSFDSAGNEIYAAFGDSVGNYTQVVSINATTGTVTGELVSDIFPATAIVDRVVVSPDNTRVAFAGRVDRTGARIFVAELGAQPEVTQVTEHTGDETAADSFPTWVSNTTIGFSAQVEGSESVYVVPATPPAAGPGAGTLTVPSGSQPWYGSRDPGTV